MPGIEPGAFHMQSELATTALHPPAYCLKAIKYNNSEPFLLQIRLIKYFDVYAHPTVVREIATSSLVSTTISEKKVSRVNTTVPS